MLVPTPGTLVMVYGHRGTVLALLSAREGMLRLFVYHCGGKDALEALKYRWQILLIPIHSGNTTGDVRQDVSLK